MSVIPRNRAMIAGRCHASLEHLVGVLEREIAAGNIRSSVADRVQDALDLSRETLRVVDRLNAEIDAEIEARTVAADARLAEVSP